MKTKHILKIAAIMLILAGGMISCKDKEPLLTDCDCNEILYFYPQNEGAGKIFSENDLYHYINGEKLFLDYLFVNNWLLVAFRSQVKDTEIVDYINQTELFKPVSTKDIWYHANLQWCEYDNHLIFVNTKEQKTCLQLLEVIQVLEKSHLVVCANITLRTENREIPSSNTNIMSWYQYFYVRVNDENDLSDLYAVMEETNTRISEQLPAMPKWFRLIADKNSKGNSLRMAQYFFETGKFVATDPAFTSNRSDKF